MAKQLVNPVERHAEKAVLAVAAILLIGVIAKYFVTSPNTLEIGGESVTPATIDEKVVQQAEAVRERIRSAQPEVEPVEPRYPEFVAQLNPFRGSGLLAELPAGVSIYPKVPIIDPREGGKNVRLVKVIRLSKPAVNFGRTTFEAVDENDVNTGFGYEPVNWVTVSSVFDVKEQSRLQKNEYSSARRDVIYGGFEVQRRPRHPDGSWSDDDWQTTVAYPSPDLPPIPDIPLVDEGGKIIVPRKDYRLVEDFARELDEPRTQLNILRPMLPEVVNGDCPKFPTIMTVREVATQDDEYLYPDQAPAPDPEIRYPCLQEETETVDQTETLTAAEEIKKKFDAAHELLKRAWELKNADDAVKANNIAVEIKLSPFSSAADKRNAETLIRDADQAVRDIERWIRINGSRVPGGSGDTTQPARQPLPKQQIWVHDARPGSVQGGQTYEYRLRAWLFNRLAGLPRDFENKADATEVLIPGPWSEPSDPVTIEPQTQFFLTTAKKNGRINIEFYQWFEGVWVRIRGSFGIGERLAGESRAPVPVPEDPEGVDNAEVAFSADAIVADIDFDRTYRIPKASGRGLRFPPPSNVCSVVFIDSAGRLQERILPVDKGHPGKKVLADRVWRAPKPKKVERQRPPKGGGGLLGPKGKKKKYKGP